MSVNAVEKISQAAQLSASPPPAKPVPAVTPFSQQLDAQAGAAHGHHHHGGASQSVTSSGSAAASATGISSVASIASSVLKAVS
jgi:hypothetical protein